MSQANFMRKTKRRVKRDSPLPTVESASMVGPAGSAASAVGTDKLTSSSPPPRLYLQQDSSAAGFIRQLARCVYALSGGVRRAHLLPAARGALLKELYSR
jgi:hypothetical protein